MQAAIEFHATPRYTAHVHSPFAWARKKEGGSAITCKSAPRLILAAKFIKREKEAASEHVTVLKHPVLRCEIW